MRWLPIALGVAVLAPAAAGAGQPSTGLGAVHGRIADITCPGPCSANGQWRPFDGPADVVASDPKTGDQIARISVKGARYRLALPPGRWRIAADPYPEQDSPCWTGYPRRVAVSAGAATRRRLKVENVCVQ